jgi:hypothetical protein
MALTCGNGWIGAVDSLWTTVKLVGNLWVFTSCVVFPLAGRPVGNLAKFCPLEFRHLHGFARNKSDVCPDRLTFRLGCMWQPVRLGRTKFVTGRGVHGDR